MISDAPYKGLHLITTFKCILSFISKFPCYIHDSIVLLFCQKPIAIFIKVYKTFFIKGGGIYDKKRMISIYYNITSILSSNDFTSKIAKASDFNSS